MLSPLESRETLFLLCETTPIAAANAPEGTPILRTGSLPREAGIRRRMALLASLCAEGSALAAVAGHVAISGVLLILGLSAIVWGYCAESQRTEEVASRTRLWTLLLSGAVIVASGIGLCLLVSQSHSHRLGQTGGPRSGGYQTAQKAGGAPDDSYAAVILWPKQPQQVRVVVPPPSVPSIAVARLAKPMVIPFDGVYWYLRSPAKEPGRKSHIAHGSPTKVQIHSADWHPLVMEAHQLLGAPVDLRCCREIDLSIVNADNRPGAIGIAVELIDTTSRPAQSEDLGSQPVRSSMPPEFDLNRPPANEVLKYPIPSNPAIRQFDEIEVVFLPSRERSLGGSQIAIRSFRLLPSW